MARILVQTTTKFDKNDWHVGRFSLLAQLLRDDGHKVVIRNREPRDDGSDPVLSSLPESEFDELWLIAVDTGNGLAPGDVRGILRFRDLGGGVLTARDHQNLGISLLNLGPIGTVNNFNRYNRERDRRRLAPDNRENPDVRFPNYHSGNNGDFQRIIPMEPVHELLRSEKSPSGVIEYFPAHPYEGALSVPPDMPFARVIATSVSKSSGRSINLAVAIENEPSHNGHRIGRALAISTFHHLADMNWDANADVPPFVTEPRGSELLDDPEKLEIFKDYIRNIARWLAP
jgi:hypothetical protein